jgi:hypothetical protein
MVSRFEDNRNSKKMLSSNLEKSSTAAELLKSNYNNYYWTRK